MTKLILKTYRNIETYRPNRQTNFENKRSKLEASNFLISKLSTKLKYSK
jgi:hypothetical protein